jgi:hypothetical protein
VGGKILEDCSTNEFFMHPENRQPRTKDFEQNPGALNCFLCKTRCCVRVFYAPIFAGVAMRQFSS